MLYATGRQGDTEELGLGKAGLETDKRGRIKVDENYRTAVPHIFAVGDSRAARAWRRPRWSRGGSRRCTPSTSP